MCHVSQFCLLNRRPLHAVIYVMMCFVAAHLQGHAPHKYCLLWQATICGRSRRCFVTLQTLGVKQPVSRRSVQSPKTRCGLQTLGTCPIFFGCIKLCSSASAVVLPAWQCNSCEFHEASCELHGLCRAPYARGETCMHVVEVTIPSNLDSRWP